MSEVKTEAELEVLVTGEAWEEIKALAPEDPVAESEEKTTPEPNIRQIIQKAGLPQKLKLALFGNSICRQLLIRESNKLISFSVLKNPRLQNSEVEDFTKNPNVPEAVLRVIGLDGKWSKIPAIRKNLVFNPKCPLDVSLNLAKYLSSADLKIVSRSKNIASALAGYAKKRLVMMEKR